jgi:hypothetical protein
MGIFQKYLLNEEIIGKPPIFHRTIYRIPTNEELEQLNSYQLSAKEILDGFEYTMIGRGVLNQDNKNKITKSIKMLIDMYPDNEEYKKALDRAKKLGMKE